jgi:hypothetical protein
VEKIGIDVIHKKYYKTLAKGESLPPPREATEKFTIRPKIPNLRIFEVEAFAPYVDLEHNFVYIPSLEYLLTIGYKPKEASKIQSKYLKHEIAHIVSKETHHSSKFGEILRKIRVKKVTGNGNK